MKSIDVGRYNDPKLSFSIIISAIFWFFVPIVVSPYSYWYSIYLRSLIWKYRRKKRLLKDNFSCTICGAHSGTRLEVHHVSYERICREKLGDLRTVCRYHHQRLHKRGDITLRLI